MIRVFIITLIISFFNRFILQTNWDHWKPQPWIDDRRDAGYQAMNAMGRAKLSLNNVIQGTLSFKPVLNLMTIMSVGMSVDQNTITASKRECSDPCPF